MKQRLHRDRDGQPPLFEDGANPWRCVRDGAERFDRHRDWLHPGDRLERTPDDWVAHQDRDAEVVLAGQVGISGHLTIGNNAIIGPQSGVVKPVPDGLVVSGSPEMPHKLWLRVQRLIPKIPELAKRISQLEKAGKK